MKHLDKMMTEAAKMGDQTRGILWRIFMLTVISKKLDRDPRYRHLLWAIPYTSIALTGLFADIQAWTLTTMKAFKLFVKVIKEN